MPPIVVAIVMSRVVLNARAEACGQNRMPGNNQVAKQFNRDSRFNVIRSIDTQSDGNTSTQWPFGSHFWSSSGPGRHRP
jgi:hypothetical protein